MSDIPQDVVEKLIKISEKYNVSSDRILKIFVDKFYTPAYVELFPSEAERASIIINAVELDIRNSLTRNSGNEELYEVLPFGIQQLGKTYTRLLCVIEEKPAIVSFKNTSTVSDAIKNDELRILKRKYKLKLVKSRLDGIYFPSFDTVFSDYEDISNIDPVKFYNNLNKFDFVNVKKIKVRDVLNGDEINKDILSRTKDDGYIDVWDLRIFEGFITERTKSGFRFDDKSIDTDDLTDYKISNGKLLRLSKPTVIVSCHKYFTTLYDRIISKFPESISIKPKVIVIGNLEIRPISIDVADVDYFRLNINAVYVHFDFGGVKIE